MSETIAALGSRFSHDAVAPLRWRGAWLSIDSNERALAWSSTTTGIVVLHALFLGALAMTGQMSAQALALVAMTLAALAVAPACRWPILSVAGIAFFAMRPFRISEQGDFADRLRAATPALEAIPSAAYAAAMAMATLAAIFLALRFQRARPASYFSRRPALCLIVTFFAAIGVAHFLPAATLPHTLLWTLIAMLGASFFSVAYLFSDERARSTMAQPVRLGFVRPFWGGWSIPHKSPAYLARFEARDPIALGRSRLKALKLVVWALILHGVHAIGAFVFHVELDVPTLREALAQHAQARADAGGERLAPSVAMSWAALVTSFVLDLMRLAVIVHVYVAVIRMAGFAIPRGMARPLSARSIAEFWNRYLFYFKEVLVDFFFYPAFARYFKNHPRLRVAFATFCAAFVGNILFSLIWNGYSFGAIGPVATLSMFQTYVFYAALLTAGLIVSQLIARKPKPDDGFWRYDVLPRARVIGFFCLCSIFADETGFLTIADRSAFVLHLAGL